MSGNPLKQYIVTYEFRPMPNQAGREGRVLINAPSKKYVRDNWQAIARNPYLRLKSVDLFNARAYA